MGHFLPFALSLLGFLCTSVQHINCESAGWHRSSYPNPMKDITECGRGGTKGKESLICDPDKIITEAEADQLDTILTGIRNHTTCPCSQWYCDQDSRGYIVAALLVNRIQRDGDLEGNSQQHVYNSIHESKLFAYTQLNKFKLGRCKEDVVLLYTLFDNVIFTYVNEIAQMKLTPGLVAEIAKSKSHHFGRGGTIFMGLREILLDYHSVFQGTYKRNGGTGPTSGKLGSSNAASTPLASFMLLCTAFAFSQGISQK